MQKFIAVVLIVCFCFVLAAPCFANPAVLTGIDAFSALYSAYLTARGLDTVLGSSSGVIDVENPMSASSANDLYQDLYDDYTAYSGSSDTVDTWWSTYSDSIVATPGVDDTLTLGFGTGVTEFFDRMTNWVLGVNLGLDRTESGFAHTSGSFDSPLVSVSSDSAILVTSSPQTFFYSANSVQYKVHFYSNSVSSSPVYFALWVDSNSRVFPIFFSSEQFSVYYWAGSSSATIGNVGMYNSARLDYTSLSFPSYYFYPNNFGVSPVSSPSIPFYDSSSVTTFLSLFDDGISLSTDTIRLRPQDKYNEQAIPVPDTSAETYVPDAITSPLDIPWSDSFVGTGGLDLAIDQILDAVRANDLTLAEESTAPGPASTVMPPFLPMELPSFNFSLSGIWHYVVEWVGSISSGAALIFNTWSSLPYAMVVPIYATLVCVIVIGLWRRFFE